MDSDLKDLIKKGRELLAKIATNNETKRKVLLNRAKKSLEAFEFAVSKLIH
jgi:hypothetical protein